MLLNMKNITVYYGKSLAIQDVSLEIQGNGSVVTIIGANGAGKSTTLRCLNGLVTASSGEIYFQGEKIIGKETPDIVRRGIVLIPEGRKLFPFMSVLNNLKLGASLCRDRNEINMRLEEIFGIFPLLKNRINQKAGTLSGGEQQMVAIGRGLMAKPKLLCMDEPSLGLAPIIIEKIGEVIKDIHESKVSVLLVEQNVSLALGVASRGYALQTGKVVLEGDIATMKKSEIVKKAYLGE